jgi:flagellar motor switch protein FliM
MARQGTRNDDSQDLAAAIDAAETLAGAVGGVGGMDLDEVLRAGPEDGDSDHSPRRYDFYRPHNISRTFEHNLQAVADGFAKTGSIDFTSLLRMSVQIEYKGLRQCTFGEYVSDLPNPTCVAQVTMAPLKGYALVHVDLGLGFVFMKKLMGGIPDAEDTVREFTEIERGINVGMIERFLDIFRRSATKFVKLEPSCVSLENNANYLSGINEGESLIIMKFQVRLDTVEGPVHLAIPQSAFGPVRDVFDPRDTLEMRTAPELRDDRRKIMDMVRSTSSELVVVLGEMEMNLEEVMKLVPGDILHLPQAVNGPLRVRIEGQNAWLGEAGRLGQKRAVKLTRQLNKE